MRRLRQLENEAIARGGAGFMEEIDSFTELMAIGEPMPDPPRNQPLKKKLVVLPDDIDLYPDEPQRSWRIRVEADTMWVENVDRDLQKLINTKYSDGSGHEVANLKNKALGIMLTIQNPIRWEKVSREWLHDAIYNCLAGKSKWNSTRGKYKNQMDSPFPLIEHLLFIAVFKERPQSGRHHFHALIVFNRLFEKDKINAFSIDLCNTLCNKWNQWACKEAGFNRVEDSAGWFYDTKEFEEKIQACQLFRRIDDGVVLDEELTEQDKYLRTKWLSRRTENVKIEFPGSNTTPITHKNLVNLWNYLTIPTSDSDVVTHKRNSTEEKIKSPFDGSLDCSYVLNKTVPIPEFANGLMFYYSGPGRKPEKDDTISINSESLKPEFLTEVSIEMKLNSLGSAKAVIQDVNNRNSKNSAVVTACIADLIKKGKYSLPQLWEDFPNLYWMHLVSISQKIETDAKHSAEIHRREGPKKELENFILSPSKWEIYMSQTTRDDFEQKVEPFFLHTLETLPNFFKYVRTYLLEPSYRKSTTKGKAYFLIGPSNIGKSWSLNALLKPWVSLELNKDPTKFWPSKLSNGKLVGPGTFEYYHAPEFCTMARSSQSQYKWDDKTFWSFVDGSQNGTSDKDSLSTKGRPKTESIGTMQLRMLYRFGVVENKPCIIGDTNIDIDNWPTISCDQSNNKDRTPLLSRLVYDDLYRSGSIPDFEDPEGSTSPYDYVNSITPPNRLFPNAQVYSKFFWSWLVYKKEFLKPTTHDWSNPFIDASIVPQAPKPTKFMEIASLIDRMDEDDKESERRSNAEKSERNSIMHE
jgi:hypothetical protein